MIRGLGEPISREIQKARPGEVPRALSDELYRSIALTLEELRESGRLSATDACALMAWLTEKLHAGSA